MTKPLHILTLEIKGFKRLDLMHLDINGEPVRLTGDNEAGKSSVFDSIFWALTGKGVANPIKVGEEKVRVTLGIGADEKQYTIERRATTKSNTTGSLIVTDAKGAQTPAAQTFVNQLISTRTLDPLGIFDMTKTSEGNKKLIVMLLDLLGLTDQVRDLECAIDDLMETRKNVNRDEKSLQSRLDAIAVPKGTPDEPIDVVALSKEIENASMAINHKALLQRDLASDAGLLASLETRTKAVKAELAKLEKDTAERKKSVELRQKAVNDYAKIAEVAETAVPALKAQMSTATAVNAEVAKKVEMAKLRKDLMAKMKESDAHTAEIEAKREARVKLVKTAKLPIPKLDFAEDTLIYDGIPLADLNTASKIRVCCALAMAEKPALRVVFIKEAALVNKETFQAICDIANENGYQVMAEHFSQEPMADSIHIVEGEVTVDHGKKV